LTVGRFTIAIMQPYFVPYLGYFRLFAASDLFVIYDCVQFPRRGWVHRNRLVDRSGVERWLTLPLEPAPQTILIRDLRFPRDVSERFATRLRPFSLFASDVAAIKPILDTLVNLDGDPVDYIERLLHRAVTYLRLPWNTIRSSALGVPDSYRGEDRILEIAKRLGADCYVNAPGGRALYDPARFHEQGVELKFLPAYGGSTASILQRVLQENSSDLARECADGLIGGSAAQQPMEPL
jgi:hypothetical protein